MFGKGMSRMLSVAVSIIAAMALTTWPALAQQAPQTQPDLQLEGPGDRALEAAAEVLTFDSGSNGISIIVRTDNIPRTTTSTAFVDLPGATATFFLAAGTSDLFVPTLSMETTNCSGTGFNFCEVRVVVLQGAATLLANPVDPVTFMAENTLDESHSHQWSRRVSTSISQNIVVKAQWRCLPGPCSFSEDDFAFSVARYN
jgi:hypothetical protein